MMYVCQLSADKQRMIEQELINIGLDQEDIENAMDSKIDDLTDTINIYEIIS